MKKQKLKNLLKIGILSFGLSLILTNCEKNEEIVNEENLELSEDHTVNQISLNDFIKTNAFDLFERNTSKYEKKNLASKNGTTQAQFEFTGAEALRSYVDGQTTYTIAIKSSNNEDDNYNLNLLIKENSLGTSSYIVKYSKLDDSVIIQPINTTPSNTSSKSSASKSSSGCTTYLWTVTTPCSCMGHTSGHCTCSNRYSSSSGSTTTCWDTPIEATFSPGTMGENGIVSGSGFGQSAGGISSDPNYTPIYIYEGEPECDGHGNCTPPLHWAAAQSWSGNSSSTQLMEILNTFSFDSEPLTDAQKQWINDHNNITEIDLLLDFLSRNNNSEEDKEFVKSAVAILLNETDELVELNSFILNLNLFQDTKITFDSLLKNFENIKNSHFDNITDKPLFSNYCAINLSHALLKSGVKINSSKVTKCWGCIDKNHKNKHAIRAEELANWLLISKISGLDKVKKLNGGNFRDYVSGKKGIIFFKDYWQRESDSGTNRTGDHIDLWTGNGLASENFFSDWFRLTFPDITESIFGTSSLYKSKEVFFWELN